MMNKNRNDGNQLSSLLLLSKLFCVFLFFFVQNIHCQIFLSEGASIHFENEVLVSQTDSLGLNSSKTKIYISSGVKVSNLESLKNYEIVEILSSENKKNEPEKQTVLNIAKTQSEKKVEQKIASKKEYSVFYKHTFSTSKPEVYISFAGNLSKITVPISQFNVQYVFSSKNYEISLSFRGTKLELEHFKRVEFLTAQNKSAFAVRPPPAYI